MLQISLVTQRSSEGTVQLLCAVTFRRQDNEKEHDLIALLCLCRK